MSEKGSRKRRKPATSAETDQSREVGPDMLARELGRGFDDLERALLSAAEEFSSDAQPLGELLTQMVADIDRAARERLEIFPVAHHSPASAVHMVQRLRQRPPRIIFMEMCEDLIAAVPGLSDSTLPVALQAFAGEASGFPAGWAPLSVIAPLTELSAEYQAIACALHSDDIELLFVDRSVDHVYQALPQTEAGVEEALPGAAEDDDEDDTAGLHGSAIGVELGRIIPTFGDFLDFLLRNARVAHFSEWWSLYVEQPTLGASYDSYRRVMFLIGSLIRRLGSTERAIESDRMRERYMWTRMKQHLERRDVAPEDAIYICGAAHTASDVDEFGVDSGAMWDIPARTDTEWLYGLIPSSYSAIERQFSHPRGTISLAATTWTKAVSGLSLKPYKLARPSRKRSRKKPGKRAGKAARSSTRPPATPAAPADFASAADFMNVLTRPPELIEQDREQLLSWCTEIVSLARKNGYLASTADSIAIYQSALLLANLRSRRQPSPGDFTDAAITCLEKTAVPGKRSVARLCDILLGADKIGQVGYSSLPALVKDVLDRLAPVGVKPKKTTITRWLVDLRKNPELEPCSDLLWRLHYLLPDSKVARPIMGERALGKKATTESWDVKTGGPEQRRLIELAYRGVTVEQVLENQLRARTMSARATTVSALESTRASILFLGSPRLTEDLGERAVHLLTGGLGADDAQEISDRTRALVHYFRATPTGLSHWLEDLVASGYRHYASMLPEAFADRGTAPEKLAGVLAFVFGFESLALSLGCNRSQLVIAIEQAASVTETPDKQGLLWATEWLVGRKDEHAVRTEFDRVLDNPMSRAGYPTYLSGFLLSLGFSSLGAGLGVELLGKAFYDLPDSVLMPWLPGLIDSLRPRAGDIMPALLEEASRVLPRNLADTDSWEPPWNDTAVESTPSTVAGVDATLAGASPVEQPVQQSGEQSGEQTGARTLLFEHREGANAYAAALGMAEEWTAPARETGAPSGSPTEDSARALLDEHGQSLRAYAAFLG